MKSTADASAWAYAVQTSIELKLLMNAFRAELNVSKGPSTLSLDAS